MSNIITSKQENEAVPAFGGYSDAAARGPFRKVLIGVAAFAAFAVAAAALGGYFYWRSLMSTPQYSLALIIDAARLGDQESVDSLVDINSVVNDFVPQITAKAIEIYGRGLSPETIARVAQVAEPVMPAIKSRARAELPGLIRKNSEALDNIPFAAMVMGAGRYLDIRMLGETAIVKSLLPGRSFEVKMMREGTRWKIIGVTDAALAERIAKAVGQEFIAAASGSGKNAASERLGIKDLTELLKNAEEALK